jgi:O-acetyl-ADP-ribose deacetylase (regulator of RNase III)
MPDELKVNGSKMRLLQSDITELDIDSFVYYAQHDLKLGSGFGTAISIRGGPSVQEELKSLGEVNTTDVVITGAGELKAKHIVHAVGPRFQEENLEGKLKTTILNALKKAEEKGIKTIAFPAMGVGFYGVPLDLSASVTLGTIKDYLSGETAIEDVVICLSTSREYKPYQSKFSTLAN